MDSTRIARELNGASEAIGDDRARIGELLRECDRLAAEILSSRRKQAEVEAKLVHASQTIRNMERSWFWRMRLVYVRVARLLGR